MENVVDEQLVRQYVQSGELRHFDTLVRRHIAKVRAMIYPMVLNDADADELTQEVFCRVIGGIHGFDHRAAFATWLHRITMNTTCTFLKRRSRNPVEHRDRPPDPPAARHSHPDERLMSQEDDAQLTAALADLSPSLRAAIVLTTIQGMTVREVAQAEGCLAATLYWRLHQARKQLRVSLSPKGET
jgi:RNA polymerase sigma-70 factor (ECF subfamily)